MSLTSTRLSSSSQASASANFLAKFTPNRMIVGALVLIITIFFLLFLVAPLSTVFENIFITNPAFAENTVLKRLLAYFHQPALITSLKNSFSVALLVTVIIIPIAFIFAYGLTRSCMPFKGIHRSISLIPLLAPSLLSAISLIYWFGNQGIALKFWQFLGFESIYGMSGIVLAELFAIFPHVLMILTTTLTIADARLYEAADTMGTSSARKFFTITLPDCKYGIISAAMVAFTLTITDFGVPKIVGGNFDVLATDVFRLMIGQQDFQQGALVALLLLLPAIFTFSIDLIIRRKNAATLSAKSILLVPKKSSRFDMAMFSFCSIISLLMLAMLLMPIYASFVSFWPYNLELSLVNYRSILVESDLAHTIMNTLTLASFTAIFGVITIFIAAWLIEKTSGFAKIKGLLRLFAMLPMAVPGLVLGIGYILFFNMPDNPLNGLYHTMTILVICTIIHFFSTSFISTAGALKSIDSEFEAVAYSLKTPILRTLWTVTLPISLPTLVDVARYLFINAMTTISAVIFIYSPETELAAVAILNLDDAGDVGGATAMAVMITTLSVLALLFFSLAEKVVFKRTQQWRSA